MVLLHTNISAEFYNRFMSLSFLGNIPLKGNNPHINLFCVQPDAHAEVFTGGRADPEAMCTLCFILTSML